MKKLQCLYVAWAAFAMLTGALPSTAQSANAQDTLEQNLPLVSASTAPVGRHGALVRMGASVVVSAGETYEDVVVIGGSADVSGHVTGDLVVVGGTLRMSGRVDGSLVLVGGSGSCSPSASVGDDLVVVAGVLDIPDAVKVGGDKVQVLPLGSRVFDEAVKYVKVCLFTGRFISPALPWTVGIFIAFVLLAVVLSVIFGKTYQRSVRAVTEKPGMAFLMGIVSSVASGPLVTALVATVIGIPVAPVVMAVLFGLSLIGTTAVYGAVGMRLLQPLMAREVAAVLSVVLGGGLAVGLAMVPWVGGLSMIVVGIFGSGAGLLAFIEGVRTMQGLGGPRAFAPAPSSAAVSRTEDMIAPTSVSEESLRVVNDAPAASVEAPSSASTANGPASAVAGAVPVLRYAGVWQRFGAALIDFIIVAAAYGATFGAVYHGMLANAGDDGAVKVGLLLIYLAVFWGWKGTTVGNIVFHLRVQKVGGGRITWDVAITRSLSLILSFITCGVGFFWLHWDRRRQAWHDKIANTEVVVVPKGVSLLERTTA